MICQLIGGADLVNVESKCAMIGCKRPVYQSLAIGPATVVELCAEHFAEEKGNADEKSLKTPSSSSNY